jgi:hypothetical protein
LSCFKGSPAGTCGFAVEQDSASPALTLPAAILGTCQVQVVSKHGKECFVRSDIDVVPDSVHEQADGHAKPSNRSWQDGQL